VSAVGHGVARIDRKVHDHLVDLAAIRVGCPEFGIEGDGELDVLSYQPPQHVRDLLDDRIEVQLLGLQHLLAAEGE
jgi:hypothetical protein